MSYLREQIFNQINEERIRQLELKIENDTDAFDLQNTHNDWVSYITTYAGKCGDAMTNPPGHYRENMLKVAALAVAALEADYKKEEAA